jgi:hypothetical protein
MIIFFEECLFSRTVTLRNYILWNKCCVVNEMISALHSSLEPGAPRGTDPEMRNKMCLCNMHTPTAVGLYRRWLWNACSTSSQPDLYSLKYPLALTRAVCVRVLAYLGHLDSVTGQKLAFAFLRRVASLVLRLIFGLEINMTTHASLPVFWTCVVSVNTFLLIGVYRTLCWVLPCVGN